MYQVSILVPVYGVEKYIERCARSLFEQTYDNLEYIFVDDCTEDKSIEILKRVMEDFPARKEQVHILHHERNRGLAAARNTALDAATSPFVSHVDSDDYLDRDAIRLLVEKQVETGADIVTGNYYSVFRRSIKKGLEPPYKDKHEMLMKTLESLRSGTHAIWRRLIRLSLYNDNHIRAKEGMNMLEDCQQMPQLVYYATIIARIDKPIYYYECMNNQSYLSVGGNSANPDLWRQSIESIMVVEDFFEDKEPEYYEMARRFTAATLASRMNLAARHHEKAFFDEMKCKIKTDYEDCFDEIGWNNPIKYSFACNYALSGFSRRLYALVKRSLNNIK